MAAAKRTPRKKQLTRPEINSKAGKARAKVLTAEQRSDIARQGARARWDKMSPEQRTAHRLTWPNAGKGEANA